MVVVVGNVVCYHPLSRVVALIPPSDAGSDKAASPFAVLQDAVRMRHEEAQAVGCG